MALTVAAVETAIEHVLVHKSYRLMDREFKFEDLEELRALRKELISEANATSGRMFQPVRFNG